MSFSFTTPSLLWFLLGLVPLAFLYLYFARRQARTVPSLNIWSSVRSDQISRISPPLKRFLEWLFASLFICSSVFAAAGLQAGHSSNERHVVFLLDNSSSMTRVRSDNSKQTLLNRSISKLQQRLRSIPPNTHWTAARLAPTPRIIQSGHGPPDSSDLSVRSAPFSAPTHRLSRFLFSLTSDSSSRSNTPKVYFLTDGQVPGLKNVINKHDQLAVVPMGTPTANVAVTSATIHRRSEKPDQLSFTVHNFSSDERTFPVRLHGLRQENLQMTLSAEEKLTRKRPLPTVSNRRNRVGLFIDTNDSFPLDNGAYLFPNATESVAVKIDLSSEATPFVRSVVQAIGPPFFLNQSNQDNEMDSVPGSNRTPTLLITNTPRKEARDQYSAGTILFHPTDPTEMINPSEGETTISRTASPLTQNLSFEEFTLDQFTPLKPDPNETCLMTSGEHCVAVQGTPTDDSPYVHFGFSLLDSNLVGLPEFPILLKRILASFKAENSARQLNDSSDNPDRDHRKQWTRVWLEPTGSTRTALAPTPPDRAFTIQPGWYLQKSNNQVVRKSSENFFYPEESNLTHPSPDQYEHALPPSTFQSNYTKSHDLRAVMLLLSGVFWIAFLYLTSR